MNQLPDVNLFRQEVAAFLDRELTEQIRREQPMDLGLRAAGREFALKLGKTGWIGVGWPTEYGGSGGSLEHEMILIQEFSRRQASLPNVIARLMAGPVILRHGSEAMKQEFLPRIVRGEIEFALGYTESQAGSDLASLNMRARDDGDSYVITGQKIFQTESHYADYHWLAARTDPDSSSHKGITLFVVDQQAPGITVQPMETLGGEQTNTVFYDEVRVPKSRVVGEAGRGFYYLMEALDNERVLLIQSAALVPTLERLVRHTTQTSKRGTPLSEDPVVRHRLARIAVEIEAAQSLERHAQHLVVNKQPLDYVASLVKLFSSELRQRFADVGLDVLANTGRLDRDNLDAPLGGEIAHLARAAVVDTIGAGTSEILRNVIATRGLGLPGK